MEIKICFLVSEYVPHQLVIIRELLKLPKLSILAFSMDSNRARVPNLLNFVDYEASTLTESEIYEKIIDFDANLIISAGWMYNKFVRINRRLGKKSGLTRVAYSDTPWYGRMTQRINTLLSPFYIKKCFDYIWVAGIRQYEYARRLHYDENNIIFNSLSCDFDIFTKVLPKNIEDAYPKNFVYIGRLETVKGVDILIKAWNEIIDKKGWTLTLIGDGSIKCDLEKLILNDSVKLISHLSQDELLLEFENSGCFVMPSISESWCVAIHEAATAGLPIVCTDICGAVPHFVINKYNGFTVNPLDISDLSSKLSTIINSSDEELIQMSLNSRKLSQQITPELGAHNILQLINK